MLEDKKASSVVCLCLTSSPRHVRHASLLVNHQSFNKKSNCGKKKEKKRLSDCWKVCAYFDLPLSSLSYSLSIFYYFRLDNPWFFLRRYLYNRIRSPNLFLIILYAVCRMQLFQYIWRYDDSQNGFKRTELRSFLCSWYYVVDLFICSFFVALDLNPSG